MGNVSGKWECKDKVSMFVSSYLVIFLKAEDVNFFKGHGVKNVISSKEPCQNVTFHVNQTKPTLVEAECPEDFTIKI